MTKNINITGLSCRFPESDSPNDFFQNLLTKKDMTTVDSRRWKEKIEDLPNKFGKIKQNLNFFDHQFFSIHGKQAEKMDPQLRLLLEVSFEALVDAGIGLSDIKGSATGVYVGACTSDAHYRWLLDRNTITGYEHTGCAATMLANRLSYFYDVRGPSETVDTACSSALVALHRAVSDLKSGVCEYAIVCGTSIILEPNESYGFHKLKMLSPDGACKSFDKSANGYARSEGIAAVILSTSKKNRYRPYAKILASGTNNGGWNPVGITFPNSQLQTDLYRAVCLQAKVEPKDVDYVEAHGTGTVAGDGEELDAIYEVYGKENKELVIGSVKSNMGHCEGSAGLAGLIKTLLCFDQEILVPNLHLQNPHDKLRSMRVMTEPLHSWKGVYAGISSFGFGGTNAHILIEKCSKKESSNKTSAQKFLTPLAHRTKEGLNQFKQALLKHPCNFISLNCEDKQRFPYREVLELPDDLNITNVSGVEETIYFACSGNGSQWQGMGEKLCAELPSFQKTFDQCSKAAGKNLLQISKNGWSNPLDATLVLVAIQISLFELLKEFGIETSNIGGFLGHSAGEIVCSYLDGLTNLEETMQIAQIRGSIANQTKNGLMASIGLSKDFTLQLIKECSAEDQVVIACINSPRNITISGSKEHVMGIVEKAEQRGIFNRILETNEKAYHSPLFLEYGAQLEEMLQKNFGNKSKERSQKWHSTILGCKENIFDYKYHLEGVLRPVDFASAIQQIPQNQIVLELGPHSILKNLIKDNRPDLKYCSFMKKSSDELESLKEGLGQLWKYGFNVHFDSSALKKQSLNRPPLEIREKFVSWDRSAEFPLPEDSCFNSNFQKVSYLPSEKDQYLNGHTIDGKTLLPATSYLCAMWDVFRKNNSLQLTDPVSYIFSDFEIFQSVQIEKSSSVELHIHDFKNQFYLTYKDELIAQVKIDTVKNNAAHFIEPQRNEQDKYIDRPNFYRITSLGGYQYTGDFQVIEKLYTNYSENINIGYLKWSDNWITFLDGMLQLTLLQPQAQQDGFRVPVRVEQIVIDTERFYKESTSSESLRKVIADFDTGRISASGILLSHLETKQILRSASHHQKKVDIQLTEDILYFGKTINKDPFLNEYTAFLTSYGIDLCRNLIREKQVMDKDHYPHVLSAFEKWGKYASVDPAQAEQYRKRPECIFIRILEDLYFTKRQEFFDNPMVTLTQHPEYEQLYFKDIQGSYDKNILLTFLSIVRENARSDQLNIWEIGTGTGGLTRTIAPYVSNDHYIATDISTTMQIIECKEIENIDLSYIKFDLNKPEDYASIKDHSIDLILASNSLHTGKNIDLSLKMVFENLKEGAFMIFYEATSPSILCLFGMNSMAWNTEDSREYGLWISLDHWIQKLNSIGFEIISYISDENAQWTHFLVRKPAPLKLTPFEAPSIEQFDQWSVKIKDFAEPVLFVVNNISQSGARRFVRSLNREEETHKYYCVDTDQHLELEQIKIIEKFGLTTNVFLNGKLGTYCKKEIEYKKDNTLPLGVHLEVATPGDLSSCYWEKNPPPKNKNEIYFVKYAALNFKDVMLATGKIGQDARVVKKGCGIGMEFSGHDREGNRWMGVSYNAIGTQVEKANNLILPIPSDMSYEEAATIPVAYITAYYSLFDRANIRPNQSILIHAGSGAVGQASIRICLDLNCTIFVTCHKNKKDALKKLFPQLKDEYILDSRTTEFEEKIRKYTHGKGVNIVLNSLADDKLQASLKCVAQHGHFLEIGKYDIMQHTPLDMHRLLKNVSIHGIDVDQISDEESTQIIADRLKEGLRKGVVKPLPRHVFSFDQVEDAFRFMGTGKHVGKVVIDMQNAKNQIQANPFGAAFYHDPKDEGYYLITGGLGGFGLALMNWLSDRGVKKFLVTSRRGVTTGEQQRMIDLLRHKGVEIILSNKDVANYEETKELISSVGGKITAVFHLAMILQDCLFKNMSKEKWDSVIGIKAKGAIHLDQLTKSSNVKYFVVFSSMSAAVGIIGQTNYGFANGVMESVCSLRAKEGLHALAIQWGAIGDVGYVASNAYVPGESLIRTHGIVSIEEALKFIDHLLGNQITSTCVQCYAPALKKVQSDSTTQLSPEEILSQISNIIKTDLTKCNSESTLEFLGVDSLQTVEIQTILVKNIKEALPLKQISAMKIGELKNKINTSVEKKQNKTQAENDYKAAQEKPNKLIKNINKANNKKSVFVFSGYGVDGGTIKFPSTTKFNIDLVEWHHTQTLDDIFYALDQEMKHHQYEHVTFLTHSAGYNVVKALKNKFALKIDKLVTISMVEEDKVRALFSNAEHISESELEKIYMNSSLYVKNHLPLVSIRNQTILLQRVIGGKSLPPNLALIPTEDILCDKKIEGLAIKGNHNIDSLSLDEVYSYL